MLFRSRHMGNEILLNTDWITSIYEDSETPGGSLSTFIYCASSNKHFVVEESYWQIKRMIANSIGITMIEPEKK